MRLIVLLVWWQIGIQTDRKYQVTVLHLLSDRSILLIFFSLVFIFLWNTRCFCLPILLVKFDNWLKVLLFIWASAMTKPTKLHVRPAKTQISLGISPAWSESSLFAWRKLGSLLTIWAHSKDWSDWGDAQTDLSLCWAHMSFCRFCHALAHL